MLKFFATREKKKAFAYCAVIFLIVAFASLLYAPSPAQAQNGVGSTIANGAARVCSWVPFLGPCIAVNSVNMLMGKSSVSGSLIAWIAYYINLLIASVAGIFIMVLIYCITVVLQLSTNVVNTLAVQAGFKVTLSLANLGFIVAIIVMAIATILQWEEYGVKKLLWKLIVAAILVNFSLVIGGALINFSNQVTLSFLKGLPQGTSGTLSNNPLESDSFPRALATAFAPQRAWLTGFNGDNPTAAPPDKAADSNVGKLIGSSVAVQLIPVFAIVFTLAMVIVILITLLALFVMLLVRYFWLTILLILMPFAWLLWIFPKLEHYSSQWWENFIKWTIFAPVVVFFLFLSMSTARIMGAATQADPAAGLSGIGYTPAGTGWAAQLSGFFGTVGNSLIGTFLQMSVVVGLAVGGMIAAQSLGIAGADVALHAMDTVKKSAQGWVGKQTKKAARGAYQGIGGERLNRWLTTRRIPGVSNLGRGLSSLTEKGGRELVLEEQKHVAHKTSEEIATELQGYLPKEKQLARIAELYNRKDLDDTHTIAGKSLAEFMSENGHAFEQYGHQKLARDVSKGGFLAMDKFRGDVSTAATATPGAGRNAAIMNLRDNVNVKKEAEAISATNIQNGQADLMFMAASTGAAQRYFGMSQDEYETQQVVSALSTAKHGSSQTFSALTGKMAKGGQQKQFNEAMKKGVEAVREKLGLAATGPLNATDRSRVLKELFSDSTFDWINSSAGRSAGVRLANWGL